MRNFRNRERDKLPAVFTAPPRPVRFSPYVRRLIACNQILSARLACVEYKLKIARDRLGWSE